MTRRNPTQAGIDDRAFPVRVKVAIPPGGLGRMLNDMLIWLQAEFPRGDCCHHSATAAGVGDAVAFYFRTVEAAQAFATAFPAAELADGTTSAGYKSPALPFGRRAL